MFRKVDRDWLLFVLLAGAVTGADPYRCGLWPQGRHGAQCTTCSCRNRPMAPVWSTWSAAAGSRSGRNRRSGLPQFQPLLDAGFAVFAVHHGSAPLFKVPDAVSDVRAAVRHIHDHATDYGVDRIAFGVWGGSAGGHLSLMLGLDSEGQPASAGGDGRTVRSGPRYASGTDADASIAAVVAYYPPVDLRPRVGPSERLPGPEFPGGKLPRCRRSCL